MLTDISKCNYMNLSFVAIMALICASSAALESTENGTNERRLQLKEFPDPGYEAPSDYAPSTHVLKTYPVICNVCPHSPGTEQKYKYGTCFGYTEHLHRLLAGSLNAHVHSYNQLRKSLFDGIDAEIELSMVAVSEATENGNQSIDLSTVIAAYKSDSPFSTFEEAFKTVYQTAFSKYTVEELDALKEKAATVDKGQSASEFESVKSRNEEFYKSFHTFFGLKMLEANQKFEAIRKVESADQVLFQYIREQRCQSVTKAYTIKLIPGKLELLLVLRLEPKISGSSNSVVAVQTAVGISATGALPNQVTFNTDLVFSTQEVSQAMGKGTDLAEAIKNLKSNEDFVFVEMPTQTFFDKVGAAEAQTACEQNGLFFAQLFQFLSLIGKLSPKSENLCDLLQLAQPLSAIPALSRSSELFRKWASLQKEEPETGDLKKAERVLRDSNNDVLQQVVLITDPKERRLTKVNNPSDTVKITKDNTNIKKTENQEITDVELNFATNSEKVYENELEQEREPDLVKLSTEILNTRIFKLLIEHTTHTIKWSELRRLYYLLYSRYAEFQFEHHLVEQENCDPENSKSPILTLSSNGHQLLTLEMNVYHPSHLTSQSSWSFERHAEIFKATQDGDTTYFCLEVNGKLGLAALNRLFCYPYLFQSTDGRKINYSWIYMKVLKVFVYNYAAVLEELVMHLKSQISVPVLRDFFYSMRLKVTPAAVTIEPLPEQLDELALLVGKLSNYEKAASDLSALRTDKQMLGIETDNSGVNNRLRIKFNVPGSLSGGDEKSAFRDHWFAVQAEAFETTNGALQLTLKTPNRYLELQVSKHWIGSVSHFGIAGLDVEYKRLKTSILRAFSNKSERNELLRLKLKYLNIQFGSSLSTWLNEVVNAGWEQERLASLEGALLPASYEPFKESAVNSLALSAGILNYLMMAFEFYDLNLYNLMNESAAVNKKASLTHNWAEHKEEWEKVRAIMDANMGLHVGKVDEEPENDYLVESVSKVFTEKEELIIDNLVTLLSAAEHFDKVSGLTFHFSPSKLAGTSRNIRVNMRSYETRSVNWLHLEFEGRYFSGEFLFPFDSLAVTFGNIARAIRDIMEHEAEREKLIKEADKMFILPIKYLDTLIQQFLKSQKLETSFCKEEVDEQLYYVYEQQSAGETKIQEPVQNVPENEIVKEEVPKNSEQSTAKQGNTNEVVQEANQQRGNNEGENEVTQDGNNQGGNQSDLKDNGGNNEGGEGGNSKKNNQENGGNMNRRLEEIIRVCPVGKSKTMTAGIKVSKSTLSERAGYTAEFIGRKGANSQAPSYSAYQFFKEYDFDYSKVIQSNLNKGLASVLPLTAKTALKDIKTALRGKNGGRRLRLPASLLGGRPRSKLANWEVDAPYEATDVAALITLATRLGGKARPMSAKLIDKQTAFKGPEFFREDLF